MTATVGPAPRFIFVVIVLSQAVGACREDSGAGEPHEASVADAGSVGLDAAMACGAADQCPGFADPCKVVSCDKGVCQQDEAAEGVVCDDGDPCTDTSACHGGVCSGDETCECVSHEDCEPLEDADLCNGALICQKGKCATNPATVVACSAAKDTTCAANTCAPETGQCAMAARNDGLDCDDGQPCTEDTQCAAGQCQGGTTKCKCTSTADCAAVDDKNLCNGTLYCDVSQLPWTCKPTPDSVVKCSDGKDTVCRKNSCQPESGQCVMQDLADGAACEFDGVACTVDACAAGLCKQGKITDACTCNVAQDCAQLQGPDLCQTSWYCHLVKKVCEPIPSSAVSCSTGNDSACAVNTCQADTGLCAMQTQTDGWPCDDGKTCTTGTVCSKGLCAAADAKDDKCQCSASADCKAYEDDNPCNGTLYCNKAKGVCEVNPATAVNCPKLIGQKCHVAACDPKTGECAAQAQADGTPCEADGSFCTSVDTCLKGECALADSNVCNCETAADCLASEDGDLCNGQLYCDKTSHTCKVNPATVVSCPDLSEACQANVCLPLVGKCKAVPKPDGTPCEEDGFTCSKDACQAGKCALAKEDCLCWSNADCEPFAGANACLGTLYCDKLGGPPTCKLNPATKVICPAGKAGTCLAPACDPADGQCKPQPANAGEACDDGDPCSKADACQGGVCVGLSAGATAACDDGNDCTTEACVGGQGCFHADNDLHCDDGDACTSGEGCIKGECAGGSAVVCDDGNGCTHDACLPASGCTVTDNQASCDDGDACTAEDRCKGGKCQSLEAVVCDDGNGCTDDACLPASGCTSAVNDAACDDGNACSKPDVCLGGVCKSGAPVVCDDANPCTDDACQPAKGCTFIDNAAPCDDGVVCTVGDGCAAGQCKAGTNVCGCDKDADCAGKEDGNLCNGTLFCDKSAPLWDCKIDPKTVVVCQELQGPCQANVCVPKTGLCVATNLPEGTPCDADSSLCTDKDFCKGGVCAAGEPLACDDLNLCTDDACDPANGCTATVNTADCSDADPCTQGDNCKDGACKPGPTVSCGDGNVCTDDSCASAGGCLNANNTLTCSDGDACTQADGCADGKCKAGAGLICSDGKLCTDDSCDPIKACVYAANSDDCSDGEVCTQGDQCAGGVCVPGILVNCDDKNACTTDSCTVLGGCVHQNNSAPCSDDNACTKSDVCTSGDCKPGAALNCNDGNGCTADSCSQVSGCANVPLGLSCSDGSACTQGDKCVAGQCVAGAAVTCDDKTPCTTDSCHVVKGCVFVDNTLACTDGDSCTVGDICGSGLCVPGKAKNCSDANPCTDDSCVNGQGCKSIANSAPCSDGNLCTDPDVCANSKCSAGKPVVCDDGNSCTTDSCAALAGCQVSSSSGACDDGDGCTSSDFCKNSVCTGGPATSCDDGDACTVDSCSAGECKNVKTPTAVCGCVADANHGVAGAACLQPVAVGAFPDDGTSKDFTGNLADGETVDWYQFSAVDLPDGATSICDKFNVQVTFFSNPNDEFQMDLYRGGCAGVHNLCKDETATGWQTNFYGFASGPGTKPDAVHGIIVPSPKPNPAGECKCSTKAAFGGFSSKGMNSCSDNSASFRVAVHRKTGATATCASYVLRISNGL